MDWKITFSTLLFVFLAELGDKTQLLVFLRSAETRAPVSVFIGAGVALLLSTLLAVLLGGTIGRLLPDWILKGVAGTFFIVMGVWILSGIWLKGGQ